MRLVYHSGEPTAFFIWGKGRERDSGVGIRKGGSEKRGCKIHSRSLVHLFAPAGPLPVRNRLLRNLSVALLLGLPRANSVSPNNKTTGHLRGRLRTGGEDKIRTCGRVTPTAV